MSGPNLVAFLFGMFVSGLALVAASASEPASMVFSSVLIGTVDDIPLYEIHFPGRAQPCYLAEGVMGGMAKGRSASLACPE